MTSRFAPLLLAAHTMFASALAGQARAPEPPEPPSAPVAVFTAALYNEGANLREPSDSAQAAIATEVIRGRLQDTLGVQVLPFASVDSAAVAPEERAVAGGVACHVRVACALAVGRGLGARWIVLTKVSKTSNLIWLLSAQLIRVATGEIVLDDSTELKGDPAQMVRIGTRIFADRVVRTIRNGGQATNFPTATR